MDGRHDQEDQDGLQDPDEVPLALALEAGHEALAPLGHDNVGVGEGRPQDAPADAHQNGRQHRDDIDRHQVFGSELGLEKAKVVLVLEAVKGRIEQVCREGRGHAAEKDLPGELVFPKGRDFLHGEEKAAHGSTKGRGDAGSRPRADEVPPVFGVTEAGKTGQAALERGRFELTHAGGYQAA